MPDKFGNWTREDLFAAGVPQLMPKPDGGENMLAQPGVGLPFGWGTAAGMAGGIMGTAIGNPLVQSVMNLPQQVSDLGHGIPLTANSAGTGIDPYIGKVVDVTGMLGGGGMPMAEAGAAGIFGGRLAKTANLDALKTAQGMEAAGKGVPDIWSQTGWFKGADGQWKFEIPDSIAHFKGTGSPAELIDQRGNTAQDIFYHPELYKAYPHLANIEIQAGGLPANVGGRYMSGTMDSPASLALNYNRGTQEPNAALQSVLGDRQRSTMLHELQHGVQDFEGFSPGSNRDVADMMIFNSPAAGKVYDDIKSAIALREGVSNLTPEMKLEAYKRAIYEVYRRTAGEVEARNVQARAGYGAKRRQINTPIDTQEFSNTEQLHSPLWEPR